MRLRYIIGVYLVAFAMLLGIGGYLKKEYKNLNVEEKPLNNFAVGVMDSDLTKRQVEIMREKLEESPIIVAIECTGKSQFQYSCATQIGRIKKVFKGKGLKEGENIKICSVTSMFMEQEMKIDGKSGINMNFVNEMRKGKTYLAFMKEKVKNSEIYIFSDDFIIQPLFCYEYIQNNPCSPINKDIDMASYEEVSENEFFIISLKGINLIETYKNELIKKYNL